MHTPSSHKHTHTHTHTRRVVAVAIVAGVAALGCTARPVATTPATVPASTTPATATARTTGATSGPKVLSVASAAAPAAGTVATTVLHESATAVTRVMRLAPGSVIPGHLHPSHDEAFFVHRGTVLVVLDGTEYIVRAGDLVHIPAGTAIVGRNAGADEAVVVVAFAGNGQGGPLTVLGHH